MARWRAEVDAALDGLLDARAPFALLDIPTGDDAGDSAAYLAELAWLAGRGGAPRYVGAAGPFNWRRMERRIGDGPILLHGGGAFGDASAASLAFVEAILWRYPRRRVIQLPRPVRFASAAALEQFARVTRRHRAFTLLVPDRTSRKLAERFGCDVRLCPEMMPGPLARGTPTRPLLWLGDGTGGEGGGAELARILADEPDALVAPWPPVLSDSPGAASRSDRIRAVLRGGSGVRLGISRARAEAGLARGLALLRTARFVVTDRPDAHRLCLLLGIPHCVVDADGTFADRVAAPMAGVPVVSSDAQALHCYRRFRDDRRARSGR